MSLDEDTRKALWDTLGPNVFNQIKTVIPDFFNDKYIVTKLVEKPEGEQIRGYPLVQLLEPEAVASTHPGITTGTIVNVHEMLPELMREGYNVTLSPTKIRAYDIGPKSLMIAPIDSLVIAEFPKDGQEFKDSEVFYRNGARLYKGKSVGYGKLNTHQYFEGSGRLHVHFAFTPQKGEEKRPNVFIEDRTWNLRNSKL